MQERALGSQSASSSAPSLRERSRRASARPIRSLWSSPCSVAHWAPRWPDISAERRRAPPSCWPFEREVRYVFPRSPSDGGWACIRRWARAGKSAESVSQVRVRVGTLVDGGNPDFVPDPPHHLDH